MKADTPSDEDLKQWGALGGKQVTEKKRAVYIAPSGDKLKNWSEAAAIISEQKSETEKGDKKRGKENASVAAPAAKKAKADVAKDDKATDVKEEEAVGSGRRAAQGKEYKEKTARTTKDQYILVVEEEEVETEALAFEQTASEKGGAKRRLMNFTVEIEEGQPLAIDRISISPSAVHLSGTVYPEDGPISKAKGRKVTQPIGPVKEWKVVYSGDNASIVLKTATAIYEVSKPAHKYKATFAELLEQVEICKVVYSALGPEGGSIQSSMEDVLAKMTRAKIGRNYGSAKDALLLNGKFVLSQLKAMTTQCVSSGKFLGKGVTFEDSNFGKSLAEEVAKGPHVTNVMTNGIRILDAPEAAPAAPAAVDAMMEADEEFARKLQAKMSAQASGAGGARAKNASSAYVRISPEEIADDYPLPKQYEKEEEETDEYLYAEEDLLGADPMYLPKKVLHDFAFYNSEGFLSTLELVPTEDGYNHDVDVYASGTVVEDDGNWDGFGGPSAAQGGDEAGGGGSSSAAAAGTTESKKPEGMRVFLSEIKSWHVEVGFDSLSFTVTTEVAVYRLGSPSLKYAPWFKTVTTAVRAAVIALGLISSETRAARLSFSDVAKRISELPDTDAAFISKKVPWVERFLVVHGQIILSQFKHYPVKAVGKSAFVSELKDKMEVRKHSKLYQSKGKVKAMVKVKNSNPMRNRAAVGLKAKPMSATATTLVKSVWQGYFRGSRAKKEDEAVDGGQEPVAKEVEEDENEEEDEEGVENALAGTTAAPSKAAKKKDGASASSGRAKAKNITPKFASAISTDSSSRALYRSAKLGDLDINLGQIVELRDSTEDSESQATTLGLVTTLFTEKSGKPMMQVRKMVRAPDTVLGDAGQEWDLMMTEDLEDWELDSDILRVLDAECTAHRPWDWNLRRKHFHDDEAVRKINDETKASGGSSFKYLYRHLYKPDDGMFGIIPEQMVKITGNYLESAPEPADLTHSSDGKSIILKGTEYKIGDFVYLDPYTFTKDGGAAAAKKKKKAAASKKRSRKEEQDDDDDDEEGEEEEEEDHNMVDPDEPDEAEKALAYARKSGKHKGSNAGLKAFVIAQITTIATRPSSVKVRRFYRPEDVSRDHAYSTEWWEVYAGPDTEVAVNDLDKIIRKCTVRLGGNKPGRFFQDEFVCTGSYDPSKASTGASSSSSSSSSGVTAPPATLLREGAAAQGKAKGKPAASEPAKLQDAIEEPESTVAMKSMDIFAGCGGLSEGMHQAGVAVSHWAIEYEPSAAEAFKLNNPSAATFCNNCNVLLRAAMEKAGQADDCDACDDAMEAAARLDPSERDKLPPPGDVEFIMGGPPCQGYSGMNRFNKSNWSLVQNSMVMAYLSYCEFYRPRYFLLENVRNFVSHNKSFTFRLTLATLLEMGYQVRFGVLNAGNYGVPQSRKRTIIWAAAPGEHLPKWPTPSHVFLSPQLTINLPGGVQYTAVPNQIGAPLRAVTVKDAIFDLPSIANGYQKEDPIDHPASKRVSAYQKFIQGNAGTKITDHICKEMNELNLERCKCIPKNQPGADWRVLQEIVAADPSREKFNGQPLVPWCLPNTADRHNGWRGLFGRLDANGHFPTSTTDPQPMGKVGQVFHPEQDRIVSVRECARSQGFPDHFKFAGNVHSKHRQVGNAVPPPLAAALGRCLRVVLEDKRVQEIAEREAAMGL